MPHQCNALACHGGACFSLPTPACGRILSQLPGWERTLMLRVKLSRFLASVLAVAAVLALYRHLLSVNNTTVALSLLLVILGVSARWGLAEATVASLVAVLGLNYYFLEPIGTFTIEDPQNWVALVAFLVTAVTASQLSERVRRRAAEAEARPPGVEGASPTGQDMTLSG